MKRIMMAPAFLLLCMAAGAQQKEGNVTYQRVVQMQVSFSGMSEEMQRMIPKSRTDKYELSFGNNQSVWKQAEPDNADDMTTSDGGGVQMRFVVAGSNDILYNNFETLKKVEQRELMDRKFIIDDSIRPLKWKMTGETKTILNHNCMKATTTQISQRMQMKMTDGKMERSEVTDTSAVVAWFATDIPVPAGPSEYQGQLPGLILEMDVNNGKQTYTALDISPKVDLSSIKEPTGKKHYTPEEFKKEREKMMAEMQKNNNGGGMRVIRGM